MMEHYVDTPWREQCLYAFDARNQMLCGYYAFENGITVPDFTSQDKEPLFEMNSNAQDTGVQAQSAQSNQADGSTKRLKYNA